MSNYATLKAAISTAIKQNGNEEITGQVLQTTLLSMVDSLVSGYLFKGIATPSTVVGTPDENVFWIAPAGSYSNFGATPIDVPTGCIGVFQYNGSFTNTVVYVGGTVDISALSHTAYASLSQALGDLPAALHIGGIEVRYQDSTTSKFVKYRLMATSWSTAESDWQGVDNEPTAGSNNLVKSGGTHKYICDSEEMAALADGNVTLTSTEDGYFWRLIDGSFQKQSNSDFSIVHYNVSQLSLIYIKARIPNSAYILFFDTNDNIIYTFTGNSSSGYNVDRNFFVPVECVRIDISYVNELDITVQAINGYDKRIERLTSECNQIQNECNQIHTTLYGGIRLSEIENSAFYSSPTGTKNTTIADFSIAHYDIIGSVSTVHIKGRTVNTTYILFFGEDNSVLSYYTGNIGDGINTDDDYSVPDGCTHFGVSYVNLYELTVTADGIVQEIEAINEIISKKSYTGKKIGLIGDSIAANGGFIAKAADILGFTYKNVAIGGWMLGDKEGVSVYKQVNGVTPANVGLDGDEDMVIIFAGTNDFGHALTIGEPYIVDADGHRSANQDDLTTCGGLEKTIQTLYTKYNGYIPIIICLPLQRSLEGSYSSGGSWDKNEIDKYMDDYIDGIKAVAQYYGIPVCDFYNINMNPNIPAANTKYFSDGLHPNTAGHNLMGRWLAKFIEAHAFDV